MDKDQNKAALYYTLQGQGPAIVLIHGFLEDHSMWDQFVSSLSKIRTVVCVDLPGHGKSPLQIEQPTMEAYSQSVIAVLNGESINSFSLAGHSMGGYVALAIAEQFPKRVEKLLLLNSTFLEDSTERKAKRQQAMGVIEQNPGLFVKTVIPNLFPVDQRKNLKGVIDNLILAALKISAETIIAASLAMMNRPDRTKIFNSYKESGSILIAKKDELVDSKAIIALAKAGKNNFEMIDGGHMSPFENIDYVRNFLTYYG